MKNNRWTRDDIEMLEYMVSEGWSYIRIARELDRTKKAIEIAVHKNGFNKNPRPKPRIKLKKPVVNTNPPIPAEFVVTGALNERSLVYGLVYGFDIGCITAGAVASAMYLGAV